MTQALVYGVGTSAFGKQENRSGPELAATAIREAMQDAGERRVDAVFAATVFGGTGSSQRALSSFGITGVPIVTVENACASGTTAFHEAVAAVESGRYTRVLALGLERMTARFTGAIEPEEDDCEGRQGMAMPAIYGMSAARYQAEFGVTDRQLALVSVKNHEHGMLNSRAQARRRVTVDEVLRSRMIADPLTLLQCCAIADGSAAAVIGPDRGQERDVRILSSVLVSGHPWDQRSQRVWGYEIVQSASALAYEQAGLGPGDMDVLEVHDAFTIGEIVTVEALGLAAMGEGVGLLEDGRTRLGGAQPVNTSGGLLSRGHALGATGLAQLAEVVWQLRGDAGDRQVAGAQIGLVETMGGGAALLDGNACVVVVLGR